MCVTHPRCTQLGYDSGNACSFSWSMTAAACVVVSKIRVYSPADNSKTRAGRLPFTITKSVPPWERQVPTASTRGSSEPRLRMPRSHTHGSFAIVAVRMSVRCTTRSSLRTANTFSAAVRITLMRSERIRRLAMVLSCPTQPQLSSRTHLCRGGFRPLGLRGRAGGGGGPGSPPGRRGGSGGAGGGGGWVFWGVCSLMVARKNKPGLERGGGQVHATREHGVEERRVPPGLLPEHVGIVAKRGGGVVTVGEDNAEKVTRALNAVGNTLDGERRRRGSGYGVGGAVKGGVGRGIRCSKGCKAGGHRNRIAREGSGLIHRAERREQLHDVGAGTAGGLGGGGARGPGWPEGVPA